MRKTIRPNKLNHKPQGVCEENKKEFEEEKKNDSRLKYFAVEDLIWKPVQEQYRDQFKRNSLHGSFKA